VAHAQRGRRVFRHACQRLARQGGEAVATAAGTAYVDVGTLGGYREAMQLLAKAAQSPEARRITPLQLQAGRR